MRLSAFLCASSLFGLMAGTLPAQAESLASSAAGAGSASVGSVSGSMKSSTSSTDGGKRAEGRYRVTAVADAGAGQLQISLQADGDAAPGVATVTLTVPQQTLSPRGLTPGDLVQATPRPYGTEFAHGDTRAAFFLVLDQAWHRELAPRPVVL